MGNWSASGRFAAVARGIVAGVLLGLGPWMGISAAPPLPGTALQGDLLVNTQAASDISPNPSIARSPQGDSVVVWTGHPALALGPNHYTYIQRYDRHGKAQGSPAWATPLALMQQTSPDVGMDAAGNFVATWVAGTDIYAKRFNANGVGQGGDFRVNTTTAGDQSEPAIAVSPTGDFVVVWQGPAQAGGDFDIFARRYNAAGTAQGGEFRVNLTIPTNQSDPSVAVDAGGNFVVSWTSAVGEAAGDFEGIYMMRFNSSGIPLVQGEGEIHVNVTTAGSQTSSRVAMSPAGQLVATWVGGRDGLPAVFARRFDANGLALGSEFNVNITPASAAPWPSVAVSATGEFAIAWQGADVSGGGVYFRRFNAAGVPQSEDLPLNENTAGEQSRPSLAMDADGDYAAVWQSSSGAEYNTMHRAFVGTTPIDLAVSVTDSPDPAGTSASLTYTISIQNISTAEAPTGNLSIDSAIKSATGVVLAHQMPTTLRYSSINGSDAGWTCALGTRAPSELLCNYDRSLGAGTSTSLLVKTTTPSVEPADALVTSTELFGRQSDDQISNNTTTNSTYACAQPVQGAINWGGSSYSEDESAGGVTLQLTRTGGACGPVSAIVATADGSAISGQDYQAVTTTLSWANGDSSPKPVTIPLIDDSIYERTESFVGAISSVQGASIGAPLTSIQITETDAAPTFAIGDKTANEGAGTVTLTVTKSGQTAFSHSLGYSTEDQTAAAGTDYTSASGTLTFAPNATSMPIPISILQDAVFEGSETFAVNISDVTEGATIADAVGIATIANDDTAPAFSAVPVSALESSALIFTVSKSGSTALSHSVNFATANGTATAPSDFASTSGTLNFAPEDTSKTVTVMVINDTSYEGDETLKLNLSAPTNSAKVATVNTTGTIIDDEMAPKFWIDDPTASEDAATITFTVTRDALSALSQSVNYTTVNGTATATADFISKSGTLTFAPGVDSQTITVSLVNDAVYETNETFKIALSSATNGAVIGDSEGVGTIQNDDAAPVFSVNQPAAVTEGGLDIDFTITKSGQTARSHTVSYRTVNGTAVAPDDFTALPLTSVTFAAGETEKHVYVSTKQDSIYEGSESFTLPLSSPTNGATLHAQNRTGTGIIVDDEEPPSFSITIAPANINEGSSATYTVAKGAASSLTHVVTVTTQTDSAGVNDFTQLNNLQLTFGPGDTTKTFSITAANDGIYEATESFIVKIVSATNAVFDAASKVTAIANMSPAPTLSVSSASAVESTNGSSVLFTITKTGSTELQHSVNFATANGTAIAGSDFTSTSGAATFQPSTQTQTFQVSVPVINDAVFEGNEQFALNLSAPSNGATITTSSGTGTISDDAADTPKLRLTSSSVTVTEGGSATLSVERVGQSVFSHSVSYNFSWGNAASNDISGVATSGTLTIAPGETAKAITFSAVDDSIYETTETANFSISNPTSGAELIAPNVAQITINDNDAPPTFSVGLVSITEGQSGSVRISRSGNAEAPQDVSWVTVSGTAISGQHFNPAASSVRFEPGQTYADVSVSTINNNVADPQLRQFKVRVTNPVGGATSEGNVTIVDDEPIPRFSVFDAAPVFEGGTAQFTVALNVTSSAAHSVNYAVSGGSATLGADLPAASGAVQISAGQTQVVIQIPTSQDSVGEDTETFSLSLSSPSNGAQLDRANAIGTIKDDEPGSLSFYSTTMTVNEGANQTVSVYRHGGSYGTASVRVTVVGGGSATSGVDYEPIGEVWLNWGDGDASTKSFQLVAKSDNLSSESRERVYLGLSNASGAAIGSGSAWVDIVDTTPDPVVSWIGEGVTIKETNVSTVITAQLSNPSAKAVTVYFNLNNSTAPAGSYTRTPNTSQLTIPANALTAQMTLASVDDTVAAEPDQQVYFNMTSAQYGTIGSPSTYRVTIVDNELPSIGFVNTEITVYENVGVPDAWFKRTGRQDIQSTVRVTFEEGTAKKNSDFGNYYCDITLPADTDWLWKCNIGVVDDSTIEGTEYYYLKLSSPGNATIGSNNRIKINIIDNDGGSARAASSSCHHGCCVDAAEINESGDSFDMNDDPPQPTTATEIAEPADIELYPDLQENMQVVPVCP